MSSSLSDQQLLHKPATDQSQHPAVPRVSSSEGRRYRVSGSRLAIPLPPHDIRVRRELAHRRTFLAIGRHVLRVVSLHVLDAACVALAAYAALEVVPFGTDASSVPLVVGLMLLGLEGRGAYRAAHGRRDPWRIVSGLGLGGVAAVMVSALMPVEELPLSFVIISSLFAMITVVVERVVVDALIRQAYAHGVGLRRALVVGRASDLEEVISALRSDEQRDHLIVGHVVPGATAEPGALGTIVDIESIIRKEEPAELILRTPLSDEAYRRVADICVRNGVSILVAPSWTKSNRGWAEPVVIGNMPGFWLHPVGLEVPSLILKRATDLVLTSLLLVFCAPLIALIGVAIKLDSRGPVFFKQRRVGLGGREFTMWKFRSMAHMAERRREDIAHLNHYADARLFKTKHDPRITRVGKWLRRFSLDELPQLFNVMAGDMSLVGPRPPLPSEVKAYEQRHYVRLTVVPGMTGPWQVGGRNLITDFEEVVRLEQDYVEQWSFGLDLKIMAKTLGVMLSGKGAY